MKWTSSCHRRWMRCTSSETDKKTTNLQELTSAPVFFWEKEDRNAKMQKFVQINLGKEVKFVHLLLRLSNLRQTGPRLTEVV